MIIPGHSNYFKKIQALKISWKFHSHCCMLFSYTCAFYLEPESHATKIKSGPNDLLEHQNAAEKIKEGRNDLPEPLEGDAGSWSGMTQLRSTAPEAHKKRRARLTALRFLLLYGLSLVFRRLQPSPISIKGNRPLITVYGVRPSIATSDRDRLPFRGRPSFHP